MRHGFFEAVAKALLRLTDGFFHTLIPGITIRWGHLLLYHSGWMIRVLKRGLRPPDENGQADGQGAPGNPPAPSFRENRHRYQGVFGDS